MGRGDEDKQLAKYGKQIRKGIRMKGDNQLVLSQEAICEAVETFFNGNVAAIDLHKINVTRVYFNKETSKFVVEFSPKYKQE